MLKTILITLAILGIAAPAAADSDAIAKRKAIFKSFGQATRPVAAMLRGKAPFDAAVVKATLAKYSDGAAMLPSLFPEDSKTGDTDALPAIWANKPKFEALFKKLDEQAGVTAPLITDEASLQAQMPKVAETCKACHDEFRAKD